MGAQLNAALAAFQAELPKMSKDETAKVKSEKANYTYGYAGLDQFVEVVEPVLGRHGLAVTSLTTFDAQGNFILEVRLVHESGEELGPAIWPLPDPRRYGPQDIGSSMTYGRRYLGWGLTGTFPGGEDDDGAKAQASARDSWDNAKPQRPKQDQPVSPPPAQQGPQDPPSDVQVLKWVTPLPTAEVGQALKVYDWLAGKGLHNRVVEMPYGDLPVKVTATDLVAGRIADAAMDTSATLRDIKALQTQATDRGLMKVKVSETETLAEALFTAQELAQHAAAEQAKADTPDPQDA